MTINERFARAMALLEQDEDFDAAQELRALLTDFTGVRSPEDDELYARAGLQLIEILAEQQELPEAHHWSTHLDRELSHLTSPTVVLFLAQSQLAAFAAGDEDDDPESLVDALRASAAFLTKHADAPTTALRLLHAKAALTHANLLSWLGRHDQAETELAKLAERLRQTTDDDLRPVRLEALYELARMSSYGDHEQRIARWNTYLAEAATDHPGGPTPQVLKASTQRLQALRRTDGNPLELINQGRAVLHQPQAHHLDQFYAWHGLGQVVRDLCTELGDPRAADDILQLSLERFADAESPAVRSQVVSRFRSAVQQSSAADVDYTERDVHLMLLLLRYFPHETDKGVLADLALARFRLGNAQVFLRRPHEGEATLGALIHQNRHVTDAGIPELLARAQLIRAIALSDMGRGDESQQVYEDLIAGVALDEASDQLRAAAAEAGYWHSRTLREQHDLVASTREIEELLRRFAHDSSAAVRVHAANALFSIWQSSLGRNDAVDNPTERQRAIAAMNQFGDLFSHDPDVAIQRLDARRLLRLAAIQAADANLESATDSCRELLDRYGSSKDAKLQETVTTARESLSILSLGRTVAARNVEHEAAYLQMRAQLDHADELSRRDHKAEAVAQYLDVADRARLSADPETRLIEVVALGQLCFDLLAMKNWESVVHQTRRMLLATATTEGSPETTTRAQRLRAQAWLHLGIALNRLGDRRGAIEAYDSLAEFVVAGSDGETIDTASNGLYNRAVLIDESGDLPAAVIAYEKFVEFQRHLAQTDRLALLEVKALRNKTIALTTLRRHSEAVDASRRVLAICAVHNTPDFADRARTAAFALADSYRAQGDFPQAAAIYEWMLSSDGPAFAAQDLQEIQRLLKQTKRGGKRAWLPW